MKTLIDSHECLEPSAIPSSVEEVIGLLVDRAKVDRKGVFWTLGINYRQVLAAKHESSLGYGTPGILLTLLEYYRRTHDKEIANLLEKGAAWIQNRMLTAPFQHGFYTGIGGLWFLWREFDKVFPGHLGTWSTAAQTALASPKQGEQPASLACGTAGTITGVLSALALSREEEVTLINPLLDQLIAATKLSPDGVFWDYNPTSLCPPLGFLYGNAGVDYCLAKLRLRLNISYTSLLRGSLARAKVLFDTRLNNWPDQDGMSRFMQLEQMEVAKIIERAGPAGPASCNTAEDALGWGGGLTGILSARSKLADSNNDPQIGEQAITDCRKAIERLAQVSEQELTILDSSLQFGLGGVVLALHDYSLSASRSNPPIPAGLLMKAKGLLASRKPAIEKDDLSLLTGLAGQAYALLKMNSSDCSHSCLDPLGDMRIHEFKEDSIQEGSLEPLFKRRIPNSSNVPEVKSALRGSIVNLGMVKAAVAAHCTREPASMLTKAINHELSLHQTLAETNFRKHFWQDLAGRQRSAQMYGEGRDDNLLFERFRLGSHTSLLDLDFDPYTPKKLESGERMQVIRQVSSQGVAEAKLSSLQFALLNEFRNGAIVLQVIREVIQRVETPNVSQRQLAELSLKLVRAFVNAGYIVSDSPNKLSSWLIRKQLKTTRKNLFPV